MDTRDASANGARTVSTEPSPYLNGEMLRELTTTDSLLRGSGPALRKYTTASMRDRRENTRSGRLPNTGKEVFFS